MNLFGKFLNRFRRYRSLLRCAWNRQKFLIFEKSVLRSVIFGKGVTFYVPVRSEGRGAIRIGRNAKMGYYLSHRIGSGEILIQPRTDSAEISIGENTCINNNSVLCALQSIQIGDNCQIGDSAVIYDSDFHEINPATRNRSSGVIAPVVIGNNVWLGSRVMVLKGVSIGDNSVVAAMSVVTKSLPANCVAAGIPAKVIQTLG